MTLLTTTPDEAQVIRDKAEEALAVHTDRAVRKFIRQVKDEALADTRTSVLLAAGSPTDPLTLGQMRGWWAAVVQQDIINEVRAVFMRVYRETRDGVITATSIDHLDEYMGNVTDRLVRGLTPGLPEDAFDRVRVAVTQSAAEGWSRKQLSDRIGAELSWEDRGPYWRTEKARIDTQIDGILDPLGAPGTTLREHARLNDPTVQALRADRNTVIKALEAEQSHWKTRADLIARTESTGANNYAALSALRDEGVGMKEWCATGDRRTRPSHRDADGQQVPVDEPFTVGGHHMMMPGDPAAPVDEIANCRCCVLGNDTFAVPVTSRGPGRVMDLTASDQWRQEVAPDWVTKHSTDPAYKAYDRYLASPRLNKVLRGSVPETTADAEHIAQLDEFWSRAGVPSPGLTSLRGVRIGGNWSFDPAWFIPGQEYVEKGYLSTSTNIYTARDSFAGPDGWLIEVQIEEGVPLVFGESLQEEIILNRGTALATISKDEATRTIVVRVRQ